MIADSFTQRGIRGGNARSVSAGAFALRAVVSGLSVMATSSAQRPLEER